mgnify:CR=1 FL=1
MVVQTMYSETFVLKEKTMNKIKILLIICVSIGIGLYFRANKKVEIQLTDTKPYEAISNIKTNQNIPIPENIKQEMKAREEGKIRLQKEEQERIKLEQLEKERIEKEEKAKEISKTTSRGNIDRNAEWIKFTATGYCPCSKCCGKTNGITASGAKAQAGVTVAMPKGYSFGTKLLIKDTNDNLLNGGKSYIVQDRGGAIKNKKIDIFFNSHAEALKFGKRTVYLKAVE